MSPQLMPPISIVQSFAPLAVTRLNASAALFAFPRSVAGVASLRISRAQVLQGSPCFYRGGVALT